MQRVYMCLLCCRCRKRSFGVRQLLPSFYSSPQVQHSLLLFRLLIFFRGVSFHNAQMLHLPIVVFLTLMLLGLCLCCCVCARTIPVLLCLLQCSVFPPLSPWCLHLKPRHRRRMIRWMGQLRGSIPLPPSSPARGDAAGSNAVWREAVS